MSQKPPRPALQPAPRPQARLTPQEAERITGLTADLGFARPIGAAEPRAFRPEPGPPEPAPQVRTPAKPEAGAALKLSVPETLWTALRLEAIRRKVTVRYLVLEALSRQGYAFDFADVPEDGRRLR